MLSLVENYLFPCISPLFFLPLSCPLFYFFSTDKYQRQWKRKSSSPTHRSLILSASFSLFQTHTTLVLHQSRGIDVFFFALWLIVRIKKLHGEQTWLSFVFLVHTVTLGYVVSLSCTLWNKSVVRWSPVTAVYVPQKQTQARLSGEKLSTSDLILLWVYCFSLTLENCSRLVGVLSQASERSSSVNQN